MNKPFSNLLPVLAILISFACLGVPERAVAQQDTPSPLASHCYLCKLYIPEEGEGPVPEDDRFACRATEEGKFGFHACTLEDGGRRCNHSNLPDGRPGCALVLDALGRSAELPRRMQEEAPAVNVLPEVVRHECTGAIVRRRYSPARIAELRSDLRHVTI